MAFFIAERTVMLSPACFSEGMPFTGAMKTLPTGFEIFHLLDEKGLFYSPGRCLMVLVGRWGFGV